RRQQGAGGRPPSRLRQRDGHQIVVLRVSGAETCQRVERRDRWKWEPSGEGDLSECTQDLLSIRRDRSSALERRERTGCVAVARLNPRQLQHRLHRLETIGSREQQTRRLVTRTCSELV